MENAFWFENRDFLSWLGYLVRSRQPQRITTINHNIVYLICRTGLLMGLTEHAIWNSRVLA